MSCLRHSYEKGSIKGQRQCRKCKEWDDPAFGLTQAPAFDLSEFLGGAPEELSDASSSPTGAVAIPASAQVQVCPHLKNGEPKCLTGDTCHCPWSPRYSPAPLAETSCTDTGTAGPSEASPTADASILISAGDPVIAGPSSSEAAPGLGQTPYETGCANDCVHPSHQHGLVYESPLKTAIDKYGPVRPWSFPGSAARLQVNDDFLRRVGLPNSALPAHSSLGASSAERWMQCPGSVELIRYLDGFESEDPDYRTEGVLAHELAAYCLTNECDAWEAMSLNGRTTQEMCNAVQVYLDYVNSRPGRREIEVKLHRPELHPAMFGTIDCKLVPVSGQDKLVLEIVDYKNGAGIFVSAHKNKQMQYYAALELYADPDWYPDDGEVRLTIVQPNCYSDEGAIRTWTTTVREIKYWVETELLPSMVVASSENYLSLGEWCRFCPAKLACPAMSERASEMRKHQVALLTADENSPIFQLSEEVFGRVYVDAQPLRMMLKALDAEAYRRLMDRRVVPGVKLVQKRVDRVFKDKATTETQTGLVEVTLEDAAKDRFGGEAWTKPKLLSPAQMEALPGGKGFVAEWAYKPEAGYTVALESDTRAGVVPKSGEQLHSQAVQKYLDSVSE